MPRFTGKTLVPRFTGKTQITGKTAKILERPTNNREILLIGASAKLLLINEYNKTYMLFIIGYIYIFNCAFLYSGHYRKFISKLEINIIGIQVIQ